MARDYDCEVVATAQAGRSGAALIRRLRPHMIFTDIRMPGEDGLTQDVDAMCMAYERAIEDWGGIDLQLLGLGHDGHIGFNEPCDHFPSWTHEVALTESTRRANARFFASETEVPAAAILWAWVR